jgi:hypothetical protein
MKKDRSTPDSMTTYARVRRPGQHLTAEERKVAQETFLKSFALTANVRAACMKAGVSRETIYKWQEHYTEFGLRFRQASEDANDLIRAELFRRAVQGVDEPVVSSGKLVYTEDERGQKKMLTRKVYSDQLLSLLAKARMPEFRERQRVEMSGPDGEPIQMQQQTMPDLSMLTSEQLAQFKQWLLEAQRRNAAR